MVPAEERTKSAEKVRSIRTAEGDAKAAATTSGHITYVPTAGQDFPITEPSLNDTHTIGYE